MEDIGRPVEYLDSNEFSDEWIVGVPLILLNGFPTILFSAYNLTISIIVSREIFYF